MAPGGKQGLQTRVLCSPGTPNLPALNTFPQPPQPAPVLLPSQPTPPAAPYTLHGGYGLRCYPCSITSLPNGHKLPVSVPSTADKARRLPVQCLREQGRLEGRGQGTDWAGTRVHSETWLSCRGMFCKKGQKSLIGPHIVAQQVELSPAVPASGMSASSRPSCSIPDPAPCYGLGK